MTTSRANVALDLASVGVGIDHYMITQSDTVNEAVPFRYIYVGGTGDVEIVSLFGNVALYSAVPVGTILPMPGVRVNDTNTTATLLVGIV